MAFNWSIAVLLAFIQVCVGTPWATPAQEALDEIHDAEIFRAVVSSMEQWQRRHNTTSHHRRKRAESQVCYDNLGCFQDSGPYGYLDMLPSTPEDVGTRFLLYASHTTAEPAHDVPFANITQVWAWAETSFNRSAPTKVIVHGFGSDCDHVWVYEMKSALMAVEACNVICVDWGHGAAVPNYVKASANTRLVGKQVALLLGGLQARGLDLRTTHVIGFSLGAHVAGFAGAQLKNLSRITGLDPAGPLFESQDPRARLDSSDAMFVDVIHSNGENLILGGLGSWQPMGHVDFYPNGGRMQKGCSNLFVGAVTDILWSATEVEGRSLCNHRRAYKFFTDSLSPRCHFPAFPCESYDKFLEGACFPCAGDKRCGNMGYYADKSTVRGTLFLITRDEEPFCAHQYHVRVESAPSVPPAVSYGRMQITLVGSADINETFTLTQKDDAEIRVGVPLTRIAVPHPALQEPRSVQLTYTAYSGWLSSGLAKWTIDKLTLTDSFGKSLSVCKKGLTLDSGVPVTLPLYPGECNPPRPAANTTAADATPPTNKTTSAFTSLLDIFRYKPTPVVQIGDDGSVAPSHPPIPPVSPEFNPKVTTTIPSNSKPIYGVPTIVPSGGNTSMSTYFGGGGDVTSTISLLDIAESVATGLFENKPWKPVEHSNIGITNSLVDRDIHEDSRAFNDEKVRQFVANETVVDDVRRNVSVVDLGTMFNVGNRSDVYVMVGEITTNRPEIKEPVLLATRRMAEGGDRNSSVFRPRAISVEGHAAEVFTTPRPEIKEPILDPTTPKSEKRRLGEAQGTAQVAGWMPRQDLKPPAMDASWRYWDRKDDEPSPFDEWQRGGDVTREKQSVAISTKQQKASPRIDGAVETKRNDTTPASENGNVTSNGAPNRAAKQITVQLFPQRLAAFLLQAERFARQQLLPFAKQNQSFSSSSNVQKIATTSRRFSPKDDSVQRKAKLFFDNANRNSSTPTDDSNFNRNGSQRHDTDHKQIKTVHIADAMTERDKYTSFDIVYREGGLKSDDASPNRNTDAQTSVLVPYSYHTNNRNQKYIPLQYTDDAEDRGTEHE